jgi:hypothetical protein
MAIDKKITDLTALTSADSGDLLPIVDISDTTDASTGTTKKIAYSNLTGGFPASSTDNAIARFDGTTGKLIQDSGVIVGDVVGKNAILDLSSISSSDKTFTFPNQNGTLVITDSIGIVNPGFTSMRGTNLDDDSVYSFTPGTVQGFIVVTAGADTSRGGIALFRADTGGASINAIGALTNFAVTTGILNGTTGTDGKLTVSVHTDKKIYIENRSGGSVAMTYTILAGN